MNNRPFPRLFLFLCVLALPAGLPGCVTENNEPPVTTANEPPQQVQIETIPVIGDPQTEIWRPGFWALENDSFVWVPGKIISRPSPTAVWASARWTKHAYGWSFEEGHWE